MDESLIDPDAPKKSASDARPSMREWSPEVELLAAIFDRMNSFIQTQSEKKLRLKPWPSPYTAADVLRDREKRKSRARLTKLVADAQERARNARKRDNGNREGDG